MRPSSALLMLLSLLSSACSLAPADLPALTPKADNIIYVTATPAAQNRPPTDLPPTPMIDPAALLRLGDDYMRNGYLEDAAGIYQTLFHYGEAVAADYRTAAAFRWGQAALRDGYFQQAADALTLLISQFPDDPQIPQAYFLRGDAWLGLSQWQLAIGDFQQYLALRPGLIDSYVYERIADAQIALGQTDPALQHYEQAIQAKRSKVPLLILRERLAQIYIYLGQPAAAVAQYDAILATARNVPYRANISLSAAQTLLDAGEAEAGLGRMSLVFSQYAETATAYAALQQLVGQGQQFDGFQRGRSAFIAGDYQAAINAFSEYTSRQPPAAIPAELYLMLGQAYRAIGAFDAATTAFQTIIDQHPQSPLFGEALLERGRTRFLAGDIPAAISLYLAIADDYDDLEGAAGEALWRAGYLYGTSGQSVLSRQVFVRLADSYPHHELTINGLFIAASAAESNQEWAIAEDLYARIAALSSGEDRAAAYLRIGQLAFGRGEPATANEAFDLAVTAAPDSYYAARAADIRAGQRPFQPPTAYQFAFDTAADVAAAEEWLRQTFAIEESGDLWHLSAALNDDARMIRGRELHAVGAFDEAFTEFEDLVNEARAKGDALSSYRLAVYLRGIGVFRESVIAAADLVIAAKTATLQAPPFIARLRFPDYYLDIIRPLAETRGLDPLLVLSLIRQESLFNTYATAAAGEKGLMQVIPSTAQYIAERLEWPDYQHSDLFRPYAGIAFGAYYLDEQLELFDQNAVAALAAYNAGPGRALDWNALASGDPDLFMTAITIDTTRKYVQYIYRNYNIYRQLYGAD